MKSALFLTIMVIMITLSVSNKCPDKFKLEDDRYVSRETCFISYCDPESGNLSGLGCPTYQPSRGKDMCSDAALKKEGCYYGWVEDKTKVYPQCCPDWKKICKGDPGFDASKVPTIVIPPELDIC